MKKVLFLIFLTICSCSLDAQSVFNQLTDHGGKWYMYMERSEEEMKDRTVTVSEKFNQIGNSQNITFYTHYKFQSYIFPSYKFNERSTWKLINADTQIEIESSIFKEIKVYDILELSYNKLVLKSEPEYKNGRPIYKYYTFCYPESCFSKEEAEAYNNSLFPYKPINEEYDQLAVIEPSIHSKDVAQCYLLNKYILNALFSKEPTNRELDPYLNKILQVDMNNIESINLSISDIQKKTNTGSKISFRDNKIVEIVEDNAPTLKIEYNKDIPTRKIADGNIISKYYLRDNYIIEVNNDSTYSEYFETDNTIFPIKKQIYYHKRGSSYIYSEYFNTRTFELQTACGDGRVLNEFIIDEYKFTNNGNPPFDIVQTKVNNERQEGKIYIINKNRNIIYINCYDKSSSIGNEEYNELYKISLDKNERIEKIELYKRQKGRDILTNKIEYTYNYLEE